MNGVDATTGLPLLALVRETGYLSKEQPSHVAFHITATQGLKSNAVPGNMRLTFLTGNC